MVGERALDDQGRSLAPPADATTALTAWLVLLLAVPSVLRLASLGGVGYPAAMLAVPLGLWWCWATLRGLHPGLPHNPVKVGLFAFTAAVLLSYVVAMRRAIPPVEASQANIGILRLVVLASVVLVASDGVASWPRLLTLIRRAALAGGAYALLGLAQFLTGLSLISWITLPGFTVAEDSAGLIERSGFTRASATATHPLEYAAALAVLFPLALTVALYDSGRRRAERFVPAALIALALVVSGSRSGYLGLTIGAVVLALGWSARVRGLMLVAAAALMILVFVAVPGMVGTIRGLFLSAGKDSSGASRSASYDVVERFFLQSPMLGRGFGTFLPTYRILDNQVLLLLVEVGLVGLTCFVGLAVTAAVAAAAISRREPDALRRHVGHGLAAGTVASLALMLFFDALGFPMSGGTFALVLGLCGAYWRLGVTDRRRHEAPSAPTASSGTGHSVTISLSSRNPERRSGGSTVDERDPQRSRTGAGRTGGEA